MNNAAFCPELLPGCFCYRSDCWFDFSAGRSGHICRIFQHGFDLRFDDDYLFVCHDIESLHPKSLLVLRESLSELAEGDAVALYADSLCLDGKKLTLSQILHVENLAAPVVAELLAANAAVILRNLRLFGRPSLALDLILGRVDRYDGLAAVRQLFADRQPDFSAIMQFVGRGEGLTPAFDDLLSGMILADRYLNLNQILIPDSFWTEIRARTTRQSVQQLQFASAGVMSLRFENFLQLLTRRLIKAHEISRILDYGHSSGTDILCGIWLYLAQRFTIIKNHSQGE